MEEKKILVDIHEDKKIIKLLEQENVPHEVQHLSVGDYILGDIIIERKSINDMVSSSFGHLQEQVKNMLLNTDQFKQIIVAVVGQYDDLFWQNFKINENSYFATLSSLSVKYKVSQIHFKRPKQFVKYLKYCLQKVDNCEIDFQKIKRLEYKDNTPLSMLCSLPSLSQTKAQTILNKYDVKFSLLNKETKEKIDLEELKEFKGFGNKIVDNLREYFI